MEGVTIIETSVVNDLINKINSLESAISKTIKDSKIKDPLLTPKEVQEYLKKGATWVDANKHKIGCSRIGGEWRFKLSSINEYIENSFFKEY